MEELYSYCVKTTAEIQNDKEKLLRLKQERQQENSRRWQEKRRVAYDLAYDYILKDVEEKIKSASERGYSRTDLVSCKRSENLQFNGIFISDILKKGYGHPGDVMKRLKEHLQPFSVYLKTIPLQSNNDFRYIVSVSWNQHTNEESKEEKTQ